MKNKLNIFWVYEIETQNSIGIMDFCGLIMNMLLYRHKVGIPASNQVEADLRKAPLSFSVARRLHGDAVFPLMVL